MEVSNYLVSWLITYLGELQPTYAGAIIHVLSAMDIPVLLRKLILWSFEPENHSFEKEIHLPSTFIFGSNNASFFGGWHHPKLFHFDGLTKPFHFYSRGGLALCGQKSSNLVLQTWICLSTMLGTSCQKYSPKWWWVWYVKNGDECHGKIHKKWQNRTNPSKHGD